jgi:hypothetical protein
LAELKNLFTVVYFAFKKQLFNSQRLTKTQTLSNFIIIIFQWINGIRKKQLLNTLMENHKVKEETLALAIKIKADK